MVDIRLMHDEDLEKPEFETHETYGLTEAMPLITKIRRLVLMYRYTPKDIASILNIDIDEVTKHISQIESEWRDLGSLKNVDKNYERGRLIAELEELKTDIDRRYASSKDPKLLDQKTNLLMELKKLRQLEKNDTASDKSTFDLKNKLATLSSNQLSKLIKALE